MMSGGIVTVWCAGEDAVPTHDPSTLCGASYDSDLRSTVCIRRGVGGGGGRSGRRSGSGGRSGGCEAKKRECLV